VTGDREQGTGNREQGTGNREQGIGNRPGGTNYHSRRYVIVELTQGGSTKSNFADLNFIILCPLEVFDDVNVLKLVVEYKCIST
jgi:hypothetical protein